MHVLEARFTALAAALPRQPLADLPTPVELLQLDAGRLRCWVKRDDLSGKAYGGNKVRKLEYLLGQARAKGARKVMTFGTAGSNHALATGIYARATGLQSISMLTPQSNARYVARNLLMGLRAGIEFHAYPDERAVMRAVPWVRLRHARQDGQRPMIIAGGGSSPLGTVGFVNAGLELAMQIEAGELPAPDFIYVALGTMGTAVGLALGLRAARVDARLVCVRVVHRRVANPDRFRSLSRATVALLCEADPHFPALQDDDLKVEFRDEFFGDRYARFTVPGMAAIEAAREAGGPPLEGTYTGKAFAALLHDHDAGRLAGKSVLFWDTYNSRPFPDDLYDQDPGALPEALQSYFTRPVQPLDSAC